MTPMMVQYLKVKSEYPDALLFYRLGDFYEMFFDDAKTASRELDLVLTGRDCGEEERAPMCGVPYHAAGGYIAKLISKGYKVAICEQGEMQEGQKGLMEREVRRVITPGTVTDSNMLDEGSNNYLVCIYYIGNDAGLCFSDISTGEVNVTQIADRHGGSEIFGELARYNPIELLINQSALQNGQMKQMLNRNYNGLVEVEEDRLFDFDVCREAVESHFGKTLEELGLSEKMFATSALGMTLYYLNKTQRGRPDNLSTVNVYSESQFMRLDPSALRNLELTKTIRDDKRQGSLIWALDRTKTPMGKRLLKNWIEHPLMNVAQIINRQNGVEELASDFVKRNELGDLMSTVSDLERLATKITYGTANPRDLVTLASAAEFIPQICEKLSGCSSKLIKSLRSKIDTLEDIRHDILTTITDDPPVTVREGGMIRPGCSAQLDELSSIIEGGKGFLTDIEKREQDKTGIKKLKIGYNRVFGYYIEVSNSFRDKVPEEYIRKQTLVNCERYITQELKELEGKVLSAREKSVQLEYELFCSLRERISAHILRIQSTAHAIAELDVITSFAMSASEYKYVKPEMTLGDDVEIKDGRHPVVERLLSDAPFVPNDTLLDSGDNRTAIITGPNMAGKSTYMRQVALIALMAQIGSFVPASYARLCIFDGIFTRVGASDDLSAGKSTFMVEMSEVAYILKNATNRSLLILDEIGRGTSTYDGMSIARAVLEYANEKIGAKTLFSTHYHELTKLEDSMKGVKNYNISVKRRGDDITFLRRIVRGGADDSYGVLVAKLAGVPNQVIRRAKLILSELEAGTAETVRPEKTAAAVPDAQTAMSDGAAAGLVDRIKNIDVDTLTPIEAMNTLFRLVSEAKEI